MFSISLTPPIFNKLNSHFNFFVFSRPCIFAIKYTTNKR